MIGIKHKMRDWRENEEWGYIFEQEEKWQFE